MDELRKRIEDLKQQRKAIILAHNYQSKEVQEIADFVGDSLELSRRAATAGAEVVVLAGVRFMAETAKILAPHKTVLLPDSSAGCPLADSIDAESLREKRKVYRDAAVVSYVNTPASVKAESDICCTSSNAVAVVRSVPQQRILFVPDKNLASFVAGFTDKEIIPWNGQCVTHARLTLVELQQARAAHSGAPVLVHPECRPEVVQAADFTGSTGAILKYVSESNAHEFLIGTEMGIIYRMQQDNPGKKFFLLSPGLICPNMKLTTLKKIADCLQEMKSTVDLPPELQARASRPLKRMLEVA